MGIIEAEKDIKEVSTPETKQVEQAKEEVATEEIEKLEDEKTTGSQGISEELETGQEFIYDGRKITLTKYEIVPTNTIDKNLLWVYLYVENIDNVPHEHIYDMDFTIYHNGREDGELIGFGLEEGRKYYSTGEYRELNPGEICEGWIDSFIPTDWKAEDIEIHFRPFLSSFSLCIWKLEQPKEVLPEAKTEEEIVIPTELEAREKIEEEIGKLTNLDSDRQSLRRVADWLPAGWRTGVLVIRDDNPTRWGEESQMYYYLMVESQGGVLYVTWGAHGPFYYKDWYEIEDYITPSYPSGTTDWSDSGFMWYELWRDDPLWNEEKPWEDDAFWKGEFWD